MSKPLRVLVVEDSEDDAYFLIRELKKNGFDPEFERVESGRQMAAALEKKKWDIVISDHSVPGLAVWRRWKSSRKSRSIFLSLLLSGTIGEEVAVTVMKAGASDYVMKGKLTRLYPSIERELREAESRGARRAAEEALKRNRQELEDFFSTMPPWDCAGSRSRRDDFARASTEAELGLLGWQSFRIPGA